MCKATQMKDQATTSPSKDSQVGMYGASFEQGPEVKNTFYNFEFANCGEVSSSRRRAKSVPVVERRVSEHDDVSTSGSSHEHGSSDAESTTTCDSLCDQDDSDLDFLILPRHGEERNEESWPSTPDASPRMLHNAVVPVDQVFKTVSCVAKLIEIVESQDTDKFCAMAGSCMRGDSRVSISTPSWSKEMTGMQDLSDFLQTFLGAFSNITMRLDDVVHPKAIGEPIQWRAVCSGVQRQPFMPVMPVGARIEFSWETVCLKDQDGKITSVSWKFTPALTTGGHFGQYVMMPWAQPQSYGLIQMSMPVVPLTSTMETYLDRSAALSLQAQHAQLAAAALRAQGNLEFRESSNSQHRTRGTRGVHTLHDELSDEDVQQTTVILRNIPLEYTRQMFLELLDTQGFPGKYDFLYMPRDFQRSFGLGYVFVNMTTSQDAVDIQAKFNGFCDWAIPSQKICAVGWSNKNQGLDEQIKRYRNSPVMHDAVPDEYKPVLFKDGLRVPFPPPTIPLKLPNGMFA